MTVSLQDYVPVVGEAAIEQLRQIADDLAGAKVVHVNSTREGGGVAEILFWLIPLMKELGMESRWEVIEGNEPFFKVTKAFHNGLQGNPVELSAAGRRAYEETNESNAERLRPILQDADFAFIHDPQPAAQLRLTPKRTGKWIWRCHIDASRPFRPIWKYLREFVKDYDASIFSMPEFAQSLPHPQFLIAPSIDPLSLKNRDLTVDEIDAVRTEYNLDPARPLLVQVSRFDRFKDPVGVIHAYKILRRFAPVQLVLAGGGATDDPEGVAVLEEVHEASNGDSDIHVLFLPGDAHTKINALQRAADIVLQKSTREGFGLTVTEGLWKGKPVIGGDTGGIRLQVHNHHTGFLVNSPEGAAHRIRYLLQHRAMIEEMGAKGREFVRENFLLTRHLREYMTLMLGLKNGLLDSLIHA
jgi:trehalose synthase